MGDLIASTLAAIFSIVVILRAPGALRDPDRVRLWLAHLVMALVLWLSVSAVYLSVDALLGGRNITNLVSHFGFYLMFWLGGAEVALGLGRDDLYKIIHGTIGAMILGGGLVAMTATFIAAAPEYSAMGLDPFRGDPLIIFYKALSYLYPGFVAAVLIKSLLLAATESPGLLGTSKRLMAVGFILVPLVPMAHLGELVDPGYAVVVDLILYPAILFVLAGVTLAFIARQKIHRAGSSVQGYQAEQSD